MIERLTRLALIGFLGISTRAIAQLPDEVIERERAKMLEGVNEVPVLGSPGPVAVWGNLAFPLLAAATDKEGNEQALAAVAAYGKGRLVLFGQNSYLNGSGGGDMKTLMENCLRWASGKESPRVGQMGVRDTAYEAETIGAPLSASGLENFDVVVLNAQGLTDAAEAAVLVEWVQGGGGLVAGMTGWAYGQTSGGKELTTTHGLHQALLPAGVGFTDQSAFGGVSAFQGRVALSRLINASDAIAAIKKQRQGGEPLAAEAAKQGTNAIQLAMMAQPPDRTTLREAVASAMGGEGKGKVPTSEKPLTEKDDAAARLQLAMETRVLRLTSGAEVEAHAAAEAFPGQPAASARRVTQSVPVDPAVNGWTSTGLYAVAGEPITVTLPADQVESGYSVRIGCHSDTLYHLEKWLRAPDITKSERLLAVETRTASAFGGLVYIEVPKRKDPGTAFTVSIAGAVEAPLFVLGQTTDAEWNAEIKKRPAPWAEFVCDKIILSAPIEAAKTVSTPTMLMEFWKKVVEAQDEISNQATERTRPERIVADVQISAGYMHSGYPIMVPTSTSIEMVTLSRLKFPGWGFYHEIGHNHQRGDFTFDGTGEVTNNVLGMYVYEAVLGKDWLVGHPAISPEARKEHVEKIKAASNKWQLWKSNPFLALTTYIQLVQAFGWESWRTYLHSFADESFGPGPANDDAKRDQFLVRYSKIVNKNLGPFFEAWGIPVSAEAKAAVAGMETWMPPDL